MRTAASAHRLALKLSPALLLRFLARVHRPIARYVAGTKYRRKYGGQFVSQIDPQDDLLHYSIEAASSSYSSFRYYHGVSWYFNGGEWNAAEIEDVLRYAGFSLHEAGSVLEFACGYGRVTRHIVRRLTPSRITVSDIDRRAVDYVKHTFGVAGFYSTSRPEDLIHDRNYDIVVVVSLFSHLPMESWGPWLKRLTKMLNPDGLLLFSTLPLNADAEVADADRKAFERGFLYQEQNETRGRLSGEQYGTASVSEAFVRQITSANFEGRLIKYCPREFNGVQDAYVLQRDGQRAN
jgi:2-polyprenyl-3-methyl-5-hydroxy-6-metoxy-1,4-benzoquinol methylase